MFWEQQLIQIIVMGINIIADYADFGIQVLFTMLVVKQGYLRVK
jgi:hypothetical protein